VGLLVIEGLAVGWVVGVKEGSFVAVEEGVGSKAVT
jgi:hypothetical protein